MRSFVLVAASVVVVEIMAAVYECTRAFLKANGDLSIPQSFGTLFRLVLPAAQWIDVQAANAVALAATCLLVYVLYYMRLIRTDDMYGRRYGVFLVLFDISMMFLFMSLARSTTNLATKSVVAEDTSWALAILIFALLIIREAISYCRPGRRPENRQERFQKVRFYATIILYFIVTIAFLHMGRSQARYVFDLRCLLRDAAWIGAGITVATGIAHQAADLAGRGLGRRLELLPLVVLFGLLLAAGLLLLAFGEYATSVIIANRVYYAGGALPLLAAVVGVPYLIWLDTSVLRQRN